jgi:tetratricopeptide (TPR) repeat protein
LEILFKKDSANIACIIYSAKKVTCLKNESEDVLDEANNLCESDRDLEAEVLVRKQLEIDSENLELLTKLAYIQSRLCRDSEAETTFRFVLSRNSSLEDAVCGLGRLLDQSLRTEEAEKLYRDFLNNSPPGHCAIEDLCRLLLSEGRADEALTLARRHAKRYSGEIHALDGIHYVLLILEDQLKSELDDNPENELVFFSLLDNLFEQLDIIFKIEENVETLESPRPDLADDRIRLLGDIGELLQSASSRNIFGPDDYQKRFSRYNR